MRKQEWLGLERYVEVNYRPFSGQVEVRVFKRDPRKAQSRKVKFWNQGLWMPFRSVEHAVEMLRSGAIGRDAETKAALSIIEENFVLTSSVGRALAS